MSNFIGNAEREKLILVDFICHGVPSQEMFDKSIISWENRHRTRVNSFSFRHKCVSDKTEAGLHHWKLDTYDGRSFAGRSVKFPYYYTYLQYMFFRPSCYKCAYAKVDRCTDLTLGDFWGLYKIESMDISEFNRGYSMLIVNNTKGRNLLDSLDIKIKPYPLETAIKNNYAYVNPTIQSDISKSFYKDFSVLSWHDLERKYMIFKTGLFHKGIRFIKRKFYKLFSKC